eukprot:821853-Pyramimonas_sp.AAC.1
MSRFAFRRWSGGTTNRGSSVAVTTGRRPRRSRGARVGHFVPFPILAFAQLERRADHRVACARLVLEVVL